MSMTTHDKLNLAWNVLCDRRIDYKVEADLIRDLANAAGCTEREAAIWYHTQTRWLDKKEPIQ